MAPPPPELVELTRAAGVLSFRDFMDRALYGPGYGYYSRPAAIGRAGDFFTSVSTGGLFGRLLAEWAVGLVPDAATPLRFVEAGAHDGRLAFDVLQALHEVHPAVLERVTYRLVEPEPARRALQEQRLQRFQDRVSWVTDIDVGFTDPSGQPPSFVVCWSNELLDAMPVHRLGWDARAQAWFEWGVEWDSTREQFGFVKMPGPFLFPETSVCGGWFRGLPEGLRACLPEGMLAEVSFDAEAWWDRAAGALATGVLMTFDYGTASGFPLSPGRNEGTLRAFFQHRLEPDLLARPGMQDLTASVPFALVRATGERRGLTTLESATQERFLGGVMSRWVSRGGDPGLAAAEVRQWSTLTRPEGMGSRFEVLVQGRGG